MASTRQDPWPELIDRVPAWMASHEVPGAAVGIVHDGHVQVAGFGETSVENPLSVDEHTLFQVGSITKTVTGLALMRLVEQGRIGLDVPIRRYLPEFRVADETASSTATLRHLLTHVAGWVGDHFLDTGAGDGALGRYVASMAELEQLAPIGEIWSYNNAGFSLAGHLIELVTGERYEDVVRDLVLAPLGMRHAFFEPTEVMTRRFVVGHERGDAGPSVARPWPLPRSAWPAGALVADVESLMAYAQFLLGDGTAPDGRRLLSSVTMTRMQSTQVPKWGDETWGLAWSVDAVDGVRRVSHGGSTLGQQALLTLIPDRSFAVGVLTNADRGGQLAHTLTRWALARYLEVTDRDPEPLDATEDELSPYVGHYRRPFSEVDIALLAGQLIGRLTYRQGFPENDMPPPPSPPPMTLARCEPDRLLVCDGPLKGQTMDAIRDVEGRIGWLRALGRLHQRSR